MTQSRRDIKSFGVLDIILIRAWKVIFGGAQKNVGITDVTIVIVRKDLLTIRPTSTFLHQVGVWSPPIIFNWAIISKNNRYVLPSTYREA